MAAAVRDGITHDRQAPPVTPVTSANNPLPQVQIKQEATEEPQPQASTSAVPAVKKPSNKPPLKPVTGPVTGPATPAVRVANAKPKKVRKKRKPAPMLVTANTPLASQLQELQLQLNPGVQIQEQQPQHQVLEEQILVEDPNNLYLPFIKMEDQTILVENGQIIALTTEPQAPATPVTTIQLPTEPLPPSALPSGSIGNTTTYTLELDTPPQGTPSHGLSASPPPVLSNLQLTNTPPTPPFTLPTSPLPLGNPPIPGLSSLQPLPIVEASMPPGGSVTGTESPTLQLQGGEIILQQLPGGGLDLVQTGGSSGIVSGANGSILLSSIKEELSSDFGQGKKRQKFIQVEKRPLISCRQPH